jgi:hypothetical protein
MNTIAPKVDVILGAAAYGGDFPVFGNAVAQTINETGRPLSVIPRNSTGGAANIGLLDAGKLDIAPVAADPAYEAIAGSGRGKSDLKNVSAIYSSPGMFAVLDEFDKLGDHSFWSAAICARDQCDGLILSPCDWGYRVFVD